MEQVVAMTNSNNSTTRYEFDQLGRLVTMTYPGGNTERYQYDANSNLISWDRGAYQVHYTFDELDRLRVVDSPATNDHIALEYDELNRVRLMTDNSGSTSYQYTSNYLLQQISRPNGKTLTYNFDSGDRPTSVQDSDGGNTQYTFNDRNELTSVSRDGQTIRYLHDLVGRVTSVQYPNGMVCSNRFTERNQLLRRDYVSGSSPLMTLRYAFNQVGQRILDERVSAQGTVIRNFGYDSQRHLTNSKRVQGHQVTGQTYEFDDNDNIVVKSGTNFSVNADDQLTRAGTVHLGYNPAGQAIAVQPKNIRYAFNDQIKSITYSGTSVQMLYDGNGQRVAKTVNGQTARFLWNGSEILKEYAPDGETKAEYLLGRGREAIKTNGAWKFYLRDIQGSTLALANRQGQITDTYEYSDYGETISRTGNSYNPFLYTGQELDSELGMYHLRARHYSAPLGRFLARDPIGHSGGANLYAYCGGDPINFSDPSGLCKRSQLKIKGSKADKEYINGLLDQLLKTKAGQAILDRAAAGTEIDIAAGDQGTGNYEGTILIQRPPATYSEYYWVNGKAQKLTLSQSTGTVDPNVIDLAHELGHAGGPKDLAIKTGIHLMDNVIINENKIRAELGLPIRLSYTMGNKVEPKLPSSDNLTRILKSAGITR